MILPALTEAKSPFFRPIKYSLFPPLGLATLAGYLRHFAYAAGWKTLEPLWDWLIRARRVTRMLPALEAVLG